MYSILRNNLTVLVFCFFLMLFTGYGQTYLFAQFIPHIRESLNLSKSEISTIYSLATFLAAFNLSYLGKLLDKVSLIKFTLGVVFFLVIGVCLIGSSMGVVGLFIGFYLQRGFGQVSLGMISSTTISRLFGKHRGKALTIAGLGRTVGEGVWPALAIFLISLVGWREALYSLSGIIVVVLVPLAILLLPSFPKVRIYEEIGSVDNKIQISRIWTWKYVFQEERRALFVMLTNSILPFIVTGLFFQQESIMDFSGWNEVLIAKAFVLFSIVHLITNFIMGYLIDTYSAKKLQPYTIIPLIFSLLTILFLKGEWTCYLYMMFIGASSSMSGMVRNSFWAEVYGTEDLGRIKSMDYNILVLGTALAPSLYAFIIDQNVGLDTLLTGLLILSLAASLSLIYIYKEYQKS